MLNFLSGNATAATEEPASFSLAAPAPALGTNHNAPAAATSPNQADAADLLEKSREGDAATPLSLEGTPYEMGRRHGSRYRDEIRRALRTYAEYVGESIDELPGADRCNEALQTLSADQLDELQGIADAIESPLNNVLTHHFAVAETLADMAHTASVVESTGRLLHAVQLDQPAVNPMRETIRLAAFLRKPAKGLPHLVVAPIGAALTLGGVNVAGLSWSGENQSAYVLQHGADLESAIDLTAQAASRDTGHAVFGELQSGRVASVEASQGRIGVVSDQPIAAVGERQMAFAGNATTAEPSAEADCECAKRPLEADSDAIAFVFDYGNRQLSLKSANSSRSIERYSLAPIMDATSVALPIASQRGEAAPLTQPQVTARFELEMRESSLPPTTSQAPLWQGAAIVLGAGETAITLIGRLQQTGATVYQIADARDLESAVAQVEAICAAGPAPHLFITTARDEREDLRFASESNWDTQQQTTMETPLFVCQKWLALADANGWLKQASVVAVTALGGDFGFGEGALAAEGGGLTGLMKAIFIEYTVMRGGEGPCVKAFDTSVQESPEQIATNILSELASGNRDYEVSYASGVRRVPFAFDRPAACSEKAQLPQGVWVVTGGARGITAACALELGKRYGLKLHLIGSSALPQIDP
ncbi:MAG: hypothetical protein ACIALR_11940, partial [Blastopirellula sp. JB062]